MKRIHALILLLMYPPPHVYQKMKKILSLLFGLPTRKRGQQRAGLLHVSSSSRILLLTYPPPHVSSSSRTGILLAAHIIGWMGGFRV
jgi:hypothetical protein